jgi:hypothetical protein
VEVELVMVLAEAVMEEQLVLLELVLLVMLEQVMCKYKQLVGVVEEAVEMV